MPRHFRPFAVAVAILAPFIALAGPLRAQPLIEHVPADAIVYIGWQGVDAAGDAYDESNLKGVLDATQFEAIVSQWLPALADEAAGDPEAHKALEIAKQAAPIAWQRPWAWYLLDVPVDDPSVPTMGLVIDAGDQANLVRGWLQQVIDSYDGPGEPPRLIEHGAVLGLTVGDAAAEGSLADSDRFQTGLRQGVESASMTVYVDTAALVAFVDDAAASEGQRASASWQRVRQTLGVDGIDQFLYTAGFDGKGWRSAALLHMPAPRPDAGIPALLDAEPITDAHLKLVPRTATWMYATHFDTASLFDVIRKAVNAGDPEAGERFDQGIATASAMIGVDLETDLIRGLGETWLLYTEPAVAGPMGYGMVLVNPLKDAARVKTALTNLETLANARMAQQGDGGPFGNSIRFKTMNSGDMEIHSLTFPMVAPSWAVHEGNLYVAVFPQAIVSANLYAQQDGNSILENEKFQAVRAKLGDHAASTISFTDLPVTAGAAYQSYLMITQMLTAMMPGEDAPTMLLPPLGAILPYVSPSGSIAWSDEMGWHYQSTSPFPGSSLLSQQAMINPFGGGAGMTALTVGVMLPALGAARRTARQMQANTQARGIHQSCVMYAQGSPKAPNGNGVFPPDLQTLLHGNYFTLEYAISPFTDIEAPADFDQWSRQQQDQWVQKNASYVLLPGLTETLDTEDVALFLKPGHSDGSGISVAYQDNHVVWTPLEEAAALIEAQTGLTIDQLVAHAEAGTLNVDMPGYKLPESERPAGGSGR